MNSINFKMASRLSMVLTGLTFASYAQATEVPRCDIRTLSRNCAFFEERKEQKEIVLPDGTSFTNPKWQPPGVQPLSNEQVAAQWRTSNIESTQKTLEVQAQVMDIVGDQVSPQFLLAISSNTTLSTLKMQGNMNQNSSGGTELFLPWPPNDRTSNQRVQAVTWTEFQSRFLSTFSEAQKRRWDEALKKLPSSYGGGATVSPVNTPATTPPTEADADRLQGLVDQARSLMLSEIDQGRSYRQLSASEKAAYDKVKSVQYRRVTDPTVASSVSCAGGPNASYLLRDHSFQICPSLAKAPNSLLIGIIAHELGHSIDPCCSQFGVHRVDTQELLNQNYRPDSDFQKTEVAKQVLAEVGKGNILAEESVYIDRAQKYGFLEELVSPRIERKDYPYNVTLNCLHRRIGFRQLTEEMINYEVNQQERIAAAQNNKLPSEMTPVIRRSRVQNADRPDCRRSENLGASETGEAMSDVWYAKVLGRYLETNPPKSEAEKLAAFGFLNQTCDVVPASGGLHRSHPYSLERINQIILADHRIQKALGCAGDPENKCLRTTGTLRTPTSSISDTPAPARGTR